jgi:intracellular sulfur oxidation DsrE/DsrF family protein
MSGRRTWLGLAAGLLAAAVMGSATANPAGEPIKVVYHLADGTEQASRAMSNIRNHLKAEPGVKIVVVANGEGIRFLIKGAEDRNARPFELPVTALAAQGVEFRICENTLTAHNVPRGQVLSEARLVPSGVVEVARLQARDGYVYLRP